MCAHVCVRACLCVFYCQLGFGGRLRTVKGLGSIQPLAQRVCRRGNQRLGQVSDVVLYLSAIFHVLIDGDGADGRRALLRKPQQGLRTLLLGPPGPVQELPVPVSAIQPPVSLPNSWAERSLLAESPPWPKGIFSI